VSALTAQQQFFATDLPVWVQLMESCSLPCDGDAQDLATRGYLHGCGSEPQICQVIQHFWHFWLPHNRRHWASRMTLVISPALARLLLPIASSVMQVERALRNRPMSQPIPTTDVPFKTNSINRYRFAGSVPHLKDLPSFWYSHHVHTRSSRPRL